MTPAECLSHQWLAYPEPKKNIVIPTDKLKRFIIRRKWQVLLRFPRLSLQLNKNDSKIQIDVSFFLQKTGNAIRALGRITTLYSSRRSSEAVASANRKSEDSGIFESPRAKGKLRVVS